MASRGNRGDPAIHVGTSGWSYPEWVGPFYPDGTDGLDMLRHDATRFGAVEINRTFYSLPEPETLRAWRAAVPDGFVFTAKASRCVTHMKKLRDPEQGVARFLERIEVLGDALGPILLQLPPRWRRAASSATRSSSATRRGSTGRSTTCCTSTARLAEMVGADQRS